MATMRSMTPEKMKRKRKLRKASTKWKILSAVFITLSVIQAVYIVMVLHG